MQNILEGYNTPISLLWKKTNGLGDYLLITYSVPQKDGSSSTDTMVRIFLDKSDTYYGEESTEYPIKMSQVSNI